MPDPRRPLLLDARAFAPGGSSLVRRAATATARRVNEGRGQRVGLGALDGGGRTVLARYELDGSTWPIAVALWERHPSSDQLFVGLDGGEALAVVAPTGASDEPDLAAAEAWRIAADTPFLYPTGLWHAPLFAIGRPGRFLMAMRETGRGDDTEEWRSGIALSVGPGRPNDGTG